MDNGMVKIINELNKAFQGVIDPLNTLTNSVLVIFGILAVLAIATPDHVFQGAKEKGKSAFIWIGIGTILLKVVISMN